MTSLRLLVFFNAGRRGNVAKNGDTARRNARASVPSMG